MPPHRTPDAPRARRARRSTLLATAILLGTSLAQAEWQVVDREGNKALDRANTSLGARGDANGATLNGNIYNLNKRFDLGNSTSPGKRVEDPKQPWANATLQHGAQACDKMAGVQQQTCIELVQTRNAHYMYMKTMYQGTGTRMQRLDELVQQRKDLAATDFGKLESNTNQVAALQALISLDRQQMEAVEHGYQARIAYLNGQLSSAAGAATSGTPESIAGSIAGAVVGGVVLKTALDSSRRSSAPGRRVLTIDQ